MTPTRVPPYQKFVGAGVLLTTLCVRQIVLGRLDASTYHPDAQGDMKFYQDWALRILAGHPTDGHALYGLPGYPFLVAGIYKLLSVHSLFITELQAISEGFVSLLIYKIAKLIFKTRRNEVFSTLIGVIAALGYTFYLPAQAYSAVLMPASFLVLSFWALAWWSMRERRNLIRGFEALTIGIGIGITSMIVATIFFVLPLTLFPVSRQKQSRFQNALLLVAGVLIGCSPAILYNRLVAHDHVFLSAHGGLNFFIGNNEEANGYLKIPTGLRANQSQMLEDSISVPAEALKTDDQLPRSAVSAYWSDRAKTFIREHPWQWASLLGQKFCNFWNAYQYDDLSIIRLFSDLRISTPGFRFGIVSALGLAGVMLSLRSPFVQSRWVVAAIFLHLASILTVFVTERYRLAAVPGLLIMAAYFVVELWNSLAGFRWLTVTRSLVAGGLTSVFVTMPVPNHGAWALDAYNNGIRLLESNDLPQAERELQLAWRYAPDNSNTNLALGNLYLARNNTTSAQAFYRRTLQLDPQNTVALNNLGQIALLQNMPETAIQLFSETISMMPDNVLAHYQLANAYLKCKQPEKAMETLVKAMQLKPDYPPFLQMQKNIQAELENR